MGGAYPGRTHSGLALSRPVKRCLLDLEKKM